MAKEMSEASQIRVIKSLSADVKLGYITRADAMQRLRQGGVKSNLIEKHFSKGGNVTAKRKMANGGYSKTHNYFAGGSVKNNLKSK